MKRLLLLWIAFALTVLSSAADDSASAKPSKAQDRVQAAADVLNEIQSAPDQGIPSDVLGSAECVAVVPTMLNGGFIVGARYGRGLASCRNPKGWSAPAFFTIKGGSFGLQIGAQAIDLVMLVMNDDGMHKLLSSQFKLGADASVAAGPVGRHAAAGTDARSNPELFAGARSLRRISARRRRRSSGQRQHPRILRAHGQHQSLAPRADRTAGNCISVSANAGKMGQGGQQIRQSVPPPHQCSAV
jgi:lipid-binding SYLF domain-containing protein